MVITCSLLLSLPLSILLCGFSAGFKRSSVLAAGLIWILANGLAVLHHLLAHPDVSLFGLISSILIYIHYIVIVVLVELFGAAVLGFSRFGRLQLVCKPAPRTWRTWVFAAITGIFGALIGLIFFAPRWGYATFGHVSAYQLSFLLTHDLSNSAVEINAAIIWAVIVPMILIGGIAFCLGLLHKDLRIKFSNPAKKPITFRHLNGLYVLALVAAFIGASAQAFYLLPIQQVLAADTETSTYLAENYVSPDSAKLKFPSEKRNLIHIYLESMENSYYSTDEGGYLEENLMPDLAQLSQEGVSFSHTNRFGGPQQVPGTEHSVAAMVAMQAGVPMLAAGYRNGQRLSYPDFPTIGDLLERQGYENVFMLGSDEKWGGLGDYYRRHGNFSVVDLQTAYDIGFVESGYKVRWGLEDEKLYQLAQQQLTELAAQNHPFYFVLENADTHFPDGYFSPEYTNPPFAEHYANAIYYSQRDVVKLVRWIQDQPWAAETTIVLTGDHQSMDPDYFENWDPSYNRTVVNLILNPVQGKEISAELTQNRIYASYDLFPTILSAIGVEISGDRLGLGTNLFSEKESLLAQHGVRNVVEELNLSSEFYDQHRETAAEK